jgi:hypothetical protein
LETVKTKKEEKVLALSKKICTFALPKRQKGLSPRRQDWTPKQNFILIENKICRLKSFAYLCTPNHKQGLQPARKRA